MTMDTRKEIDDYLKGQKEPPNDVLKFLVGKLSVFQEQVKQLAPQIEKFRQTLDSAAKQQAILIELCNHYYNDIQNELIKISKQDEEIATIKAVEDEKEDEEIDQAVK